MTSLPAVTRVLWRAARHGTTVLGAAALVVVVACLAFPTYVVTAAADLLLVRASDPTFTDGNRQEPWITTAGRLAVDASASGGMATDIQEWGSVAVAAAASAADDTSNTNVSPVVRSFGHVFDGTTWDRARGDSTGGAYVQGPAASDSAVAGNPVLQGLRASAASPSAVSTDGDAVPAWATTTGALVTAGADSSGNSVAVPIGTTTANSVTVGGYNTFTSTRYPLPIGSNALAGEQRGVVIGGTESAAGTFRVFRVDSSGRPRVDVENCGGATVTAAAALSDNFSNPTAPAFGSFGMGWDGSTWDRLRVDSSANLLVSLGTALDDSTDSVTSAPVTGTRRTYSATFSVTAVAGTFAEIAGPSSGSAQLLELVVQSDTATVVTVNKRSTASSGGTSAGRTEVPHDASDAAATCVVLQYTADPTEGTLVGPIREIELGTDGVVTYTWGAQTDKPPTLNATTQVLTFETTVGGVLRGHIQWTEYTP